MGDIIQITPQNRIESSLKKIFSNYSLRQDPHFDFKHSKFKRTYPLIIILNTSNLLTDMDSLIELSLNSNDTKTLSYLKIIFRYCDFDLVTSCNCNRILCEKLKNALKQSIQKLDNMQLERVSLLDIKNSNYPILKSLGKSIREYLDNTLNIDTGMAPSDFRSPEGYGANSDEKAPPEEYIDFS